MTLWLVLGAIAVLCVGMVLGALLRSFTAMPARPAGQGIARRPPAAGAEDRPAAAHPASGRMALLWTALGLGAAIPLLAFALYLLAGTPRAPDDSSAPQAASGEMPDIGVALPQLEARLEAAPDDLEGWLLLGRTYDTLGRYDDAVDAYTRALPLSNNRPDVVAGYAESKVLQQGGVVTADTRKLFEDVYAKDPHNVAAGYYLGLAKVQDGDAEAGVRDWLAIQAAAPPDAPWLPGLRADIERIAQEYNLDLAKLAPPGAKIVPPMGASLGGGAGAGASAGAAPAASGGPSDADVAAAQNMTEEERDQMIRGMVDRLAARLQQQPGDAEGWRRLARAYTVLGEHDKAADALSRAAELAP